MPEGEVARRFCLQSGARELLAGERVGTCLRHRLPDRDVDILHSPQQQRAIYRGLMTCGSVWHCPVCAARISEHRRRELGQAVREWRRCGGRVLLVTYTFRHKRWDDLGELLAGLRGARRYLRSGKAAVAFRREYGAIGSVRALEVTLGENGWHPHLHELLFVAGEADLVQLEAEIRIRWAAAVVKAGLRAGNDHEIAVSDSDEDVAAYVQKFGLEEPDEAEVSTHEFSEGWGVEHELAKGVVKRGKRGSRGPFGLLEDYIRGDGEAGRRFVEYARAFKGQRQLWWSHGLRGLLLGTEEGQSDEEIAGDTTGYPVLLATLTVDQWRVILGNDARAELLEIAGRGDVGELWRYVADLCAAAPRRREGPRWGYQDHQAEQVDERTFMPVALVSGQRGQGYSEGEIAARRSARGGGKRYVRGSGVGSRRDEVGA